MYLYSVADAEARVSEEISKTNKDTTDLVRQNAETTADKYDVFISYSYADDPSIPLALFLALKDSGFSSYLPERLNRKRSAPKLSDIRRTQEALNASASLIMVNSPQTSRSQWIPWEIGYISGRTNKVSIHSVADEDHKIINREFIQLYPTVNIFPSGIHVSLPEGEIKLQDWLNG